mmetsp:Transcript_14511/g.39786  ORF Transcript_14511/g.39786 Transcript_14511/m.39786 type:complete len:348 (-) Transcript_14511:618-1661(-)
MLRFHVGHGLGPLKAVLVLQQLRIQVRCVLFALLWVVPVVVVGLRAGALSFARLLWHEVHWALPAQDLLVKTTVGDQLLMEGRVAHIAARKRLVVREDDRVVLRIGLMRPIHDPLDIVGIGAVETCDVIAKHIELRVADVNPPGQLATAPTAHHDASRIEAAAEPEAVHLRGPEEGLVIWGERFRTTHGVCDADVLHCRNAFHVALDVKPEDVPIKVEETELEVVLDVPMNWIWLVSANCEALTLVLHVHGEIVVPYVRHETEARDLVCDNICVPKGCERHLDTCEFAELTAPGAGTIDDELRLDPTCGSLHASHLPVFHIHTRDVDAFDDLRSELLCTFRIRHGNA